MIFHTIDLINIIATQMSHIKLGARDIDNVTRSPASKYPERRSLSNASDRSSSYVLKTP